jgi:hypothetical protein
MPWECRLPAQGARSGGGRGGPTGMVAPVLEAGTCSARNRNDWHRPASTVGNSRFRNAEGQGARPQRRCQSGAPGSGRAGQIRSARWHCDGRQREKLLEAPTRATESKEAAQARRATHC